MGLDRSKADPKTTKEIVREGEVYLQRQLTLPTTAAERAEVMAIVFAAAGAVTIAGLIILVSSQRAGGFDGAFVGGIAAALLFLSGSALCVWATFSVGFDLPENQPESWDRDVEQGTKPGDAPPEQAESYQGKINDNHGVLMSNAKKFKWGVISGLAAPFVGVLVWFTISFFSA